jgi:hypothetical protein
MMHRLCVCVCVRACVRALYFMTHLAFHREDGYRQDVSNIKNRLKNQSVRKEADQMVDPDKILDKFWTRLAFIQNIQRTLERALIKVH